MPGVVSRSRIMVTVQEPTTAWCLLGARGGHLAAHAGRWEWRTEMKKPLMIVLGLCLLLGGCGYTAWWWKAAEQARSFASQTQTREVLQTR